MGNFFTRTPIAPHPVKIAPAMLTAPIYRYAWLGTVVMTLSFTQDLSADIVLDIGTIDGSSTSTGSYVAMSSSFDLTGAEIPKTQLSVDFFLIDDGVEIVVNDKSLFASVDTSEFGNQDFLVTAVQPNDINSPWSAHNTGLPRVTVFSDCNGTIFTGTPETTSAGPVDFIPNFTVADFTNLLRVGNNTINFVNHNGFASGELTGSFSVVVATPEPGTATFGFALLCVVLRRRRS